MNRNRLIFVAGVAAICIFILLSVLVLRFVSRREAGPTGGGKPTTTTAGGAPASLNVALGSPSNATADASNKNDFLLVKPQYVLSYNNERGGPNWVSWHLQASDIGDVERQNNFHPESALPAGFKRVTPDDYTGTGFDRGHVCNSKDRTATEADNSETFSMANMLPQTGDLNRHVWESLRILLAHARAEGQRAIHRRGRLRVCKDHRQVEQGDGSDQLLEDHSRPARGQRHLASGQERARHRR